MDGIELLMALNNIKMTLGAIAFELNAQTAIQLMEIQQRGPNHAASLLKHTAAANDRAKTLYHILSGKEIDDENNLSE